MVGVTRAVAWPLSTEGWSILRRSTMHLVGSPRNEFDPRWKVHCERRIAIRSILSQTPEKNCNPLANNPKRRTLWFENLIRAFWDLQSDIVHCSPSLLASIFVLIIELRRSRKERLSWKDSFFIEAIVSRRKGIIDRMWADFIVVARERMFGTLGAWKMMESFGVVLRWKKSGTRVQLPQETLRRQLSRSLREFSIVLFHFNRSPTDRRMRNPLKQLKSVRHRQSSALLNYF